MTWHVSFNGSQKIARNNGKISSRRLRDKWDFVPFCTVNNEEWKVNKTRASEPDDSQLYMDEAKKGIKYGDTWFSMDQNGACFSDAVGNVCTDPCNNGLGWDVHGGACSVGDFGIAGKDKWVVFHAKEDNRCWVIAETSYVGLNPMHVLNDWLGNFDAFRHKTIQSAVKYRWAFRWFSGFSKRFDCSVCSNGRIICPTMFNAWHPKDRHCGSGALLRGHANFIRVWNHAGPSVWKMLQKYDCQNKKITFTGLSRGGALAAAAAGVLVAEGSLDIKHIKVVTYGAPRIWNDHSAASLNNLGFTNRTWRFVDDQDPVPRLPPPYIQLFGGSLPVLRYEHVGKRVSNYRSGCRDNGPGPLGYRGYSAEGYFGPIRYGGYAENALSATVQNLHMHSKYLDEDGFTTECADVCT